MRTGVYGGTFDPIHFAHLLLAETARETLALDRVIFVPAGIPPHKRFRKIASAADRIAMVRLAIEGVSGFELSTFEADSSEVSYTARTLRHFHQIYPDDTFFLITGSETLSDIPHWLEPAEICRLAIPVTAQRPDAPLPNINVLAPFTTPDRLKEFRNQTIPMPLLDISSTDIRRRIALRKSIRFLTPPQVDAYIQEHSLYQTQTTFK